MEQFCVPNDFPAWIANSFSDAEWHLSVGFAVQSCLRRGIALPSIAEAAETTVEECLLALRFAEGSPGLQLEALVERWPWEKIVDALSP